MEVARECGIEHTANMKKESFEAAIQRVYGEEGFQVGFEAVGVQPTMDNLVNNIEKGGEIVVACVFEKPPTINMAFVGEHELKIIGTMMYKQEDYEEAIKKIAEGEIITAPLVTMHFPFEQYLEAYQCIDEKGDKTLKVISDVQ